MRFVSMTGLSVAMAGIALGSAEPAWAQQSATPSAQSDVNSYLCTFAGKCGADATSDEGLTKAAPATKGFRLAQATPSIAAPPTKGFRLAAPQGATQPKVDAPAVRGFALARPVQAARPVARAPAPRRGNGYAAARPAPAPGVARANLMLAFDYNSAQMTPAAEARAKTFAEALKMDALKDKRFLIAGHTDSRGRRDVNIDLSRKRAQSVAEFLIAQGVERDRVEVKGVGPDEPLPGVPAKADANRRVEAVLLS